VYVIVVVDCKDYIFTHIIFSCLWVVLSSDGPKIAVSISVYVYKNGTP